MNKTKALGILIASAIQALPALASTQPLPTNFGGASTGYVQFGGSSSFQNLICFEAGCGGVFQANVYGPSASGPNGSSVSTMVWCVDYQLDVTYGSAYSANITTLNSITSPTDSNVRYGDLNSVSNTDGWVNSLSGPPGADLNSAAYRYTLAAALFRNMWTTLPPRPSSIQRTSTATPVSTKLFRKRSGISPTTPSTSRAQHGRRRATA